MAALQMQVQQATEAVQKSDADKNAAAVLQQQNAGLELQVKQKDSDTKAFEAETAREEMERQKTVDLAQAQADAEKYRAEQTKYAADLVRAAAENIHAQMEADMPKGMDGMKDENKPAMPSLEEIAQLIVASRQPLNGMTITSPSGGVYSVKMQ